MKDGEIGNIASGKMAGELQKESKKMYSAKKIAIDNVPTGDVLVL